MIEIVANSKHEIPLWKKYVPMLMIVAAGTFAAGLFFSFMTGYSDNPDVKESVFAGPGGWGIAFAISSLGLLVYFVVHLRKKQVCGLVFDDEARSISIQILPYWSNTVKTVKLPYNQLRFTEATEENIKGEEAITIEFYNELDFVGRMTANHPSWKNFPKAFKKVQGKLKRLKE